jgi:hypothetical protein
MDDPEVTLQEQIFHNAVREHIVSRMIIARLSFFTLLIFCFLSRLSLLLSDPLQLSP